MSPDFWCLCCLFPVRRRLFLFPFSFGVVLLVAQFLSDRSRSGGRLSGPQQTKEQKRTLVRDSSGRSADLLVPWTESAAWQFHDRLCLWGGDRRPIGCCLGKKASLVLVVHGPLFSLFSSRSNFRIIDCECLLARNREKGPPAQHHASRVRVCVSLARYNGVAVRRAAIAPS